ncbi:MAG: hypothetical protein WC346_10030 [Methanogenium sp.]|jgi:hypothetical protein
MKFKRDRQIRYNISDFPKEKEFMRRYFIHKTDARNYFLSILKPRYDLYYKLFTSYNGDRAKEIKKWQANTFVPYIHSVIETLMPRIVDARPEFSVMPRKEEDSVKGEKQQQLANYQWERAGMDRVNEDLVRSTLIFGTGFLQTGWKKEVKTAKFLSTKDLSKKKLKFEERTEVMYDDPFCEFVDNYSLWYDWRNQRREEKTFWMKRLLLNTEEIKKRYPYADNDRLNMAFNVAGDTEDYASVRIDTRKTNSRASRKGISQGNGVSGTGDVYFNNLHEFVNNNGEEGDGTRIHEVIEYNQPYEDSYSVEVNDVPIFPGAELPILYDYKETPFIETTYLRMPGEFEGVGIPAILENPQIMLNTLKNQRIDSVTLSIHKMWVINPLANVNKEELVARPFGIIYSADPNGVKDIQFSDIKPSAYKEEDALKQDMKYASGVDDASMGAGGGANSATEVRHLRESTLERVRLFVNHLGDTYGTVLRHWMSMQRQFFTKAKQVRILGEGGKNEYPLIEKDDLEGYFDYKATVLPSLSGQVDVERKQGMDLFQLLVSMPFVDPEKLTAKVLKPFNFSLDSVRKDESQAPPTGEPGSEGMIGPDGAPIDPAMMQGAPMEGGMPNTEASVAPPGNIIPPQVLSDALDLIRGGAGASGASPFSAAAMPIDLTQQQGTPPTVKGVSTGSTTNPRGANRKVGGKVDTNISKRGPSNPSDTIQRQASNIQK